MQMALSNDYFYRHLICTDKTRMRQRSDSDLQFQRRAGFEGSRKKGETAGKGRKGNPDILGSPGTGVQNEVRISPDLKVHYLWETTVT